MLAMPLEATALPLPVAGDASSEGTAELDALAPSDPYSRRKLGGTDDEKLKRIAQKLRGVLEDLGEDPDREGLRKTPERWAKAMLFLVGSADQILRRMMEANVLFGMLDERIR